MKYQVVILAGGESSRFFPFNGLHKSFFKIAGKTILERTLESVKKTDPEEVLLVLGHKNFEKEKEICEASEIFKGVKYIRQEESRGQADAILSAKEFIKGNFFVINANQLNFDELAEDFVSQFTKTGDAATLGITETKNPSKYGIVDVENNRVKAVVEKPKSGEEPSNMRLIGIYLFSMEFLNLLSRIPVSEYSLEKALDSVAKEGSVSSVHITGNLPSVKYPWDMLEVKQRILSELRNKIDTSALIEKTALFKGDEIFIGKNAHICDFSIIEAPAYIGDNAVVGAFCLVREGTILEEGAQIERYADVKNTIVGEGTHIHSGFIGDSVIGKNCRIGAEFITANKRLDRKSVGVVVKGEKIDSRKPNIGVFMGDDVKVGIRVSTMPGAVVGSGSVIFPGVTLSGYFDPGSEVQIKS